jgi:hypothetical protein
MPVKEGNDIIPINILGITVPCLLDGTMDPVTGFCLEAISALRQAGEELFEGELVELINIHGCVSSMRGSAQDMERIVHQVDNSMSLNRILRSV